MEGPFNVRPDWLAFRKSLLLFAVALLALLVLISLYQALLTSIGVSMFLAYLIIPLVDHLEKHKVPRLISVSGLIIVVLGVLTILGGYLLPRVFREVVGLVQLVPGIVAEINKTWLPMIQVFLVELSIIDESTLVHAVENFNVVQEITARIQQGVSEIWSTASTFLGGVVDTAIIPVLTFFFAKDYPRFMKSLKESLPEDMLDQSREFCASLSLTLRAVIKGQVAVASILGVMYVVGFQLVGLPSGFAIGVVAGFARLVPYLDIFVGGALCLIVILAKMAGLEIFLGVIIVFVVVQSIDGMIVTPRIIGERVGLHPAMVICSVLAFGKLFGFWGVVLAVPCVALAKSLVRPLVPVFVAMWESIRAPMNERTVAESRRPGRLIKPVRRRFPMRRY